MRSVVTSLLIILPYVGAFSSGRAFSPTPKKIIDSLGKKCSSPLPSIKIHVHGAPFTKNAGFYPLKLSETSSDDSESNVDSRRKDEEEPSCWNPQLRRVVGSLAGLGVLETAYLTYTKVNGGSQAFCGSDGGCNSVLSGPYAVIPFTDIPLATLGLAAYTTVALLALLPLFDGNTSAEEAKDTENRIWLTAATTAMGTFSVFLMSLLFGVLHTTCPFCLGSACLSIGMAGIVWIGEGLPDEERKRGMQASAGSFVSTVLAALILFLSADDTSLATQFAGSPGGIASSDSKTLLASSEGNKPPPITTVSSERSLALSSDLQSLNARMYGAYWCSHCFDQKLALGKEAFSKIPYIECSKDGYNQQNALCKEKNVPGYPTWEINEKLFAGERSIEELEDIVNAERVAEAGNMKDTQNALFN